MKSGLLPRNSSCYFTWQGTPAGWSRIETLLLAIWGANSVEQPEHLRVLVAQLRKKIDAESTPRYIITEPWVGYRFEPAGEK